jgi:hypothetical protein
MVVAEVEDPFWESGGFSRDFSVPAYAGAPNPAPSGDDPAPSPEQVQEEQEQTEGGAGGVGLVEGNIGWNGDASDAVEPDQSNGDDDLDDDGEFLEGNKGWLSEGHGDDAEEGGEEASFFESGSSFSMPSKGRNPLQESASSAGAASKDESSDQQDISTSALEGRQGAPNASASSAGVGATASHTGTIHIGEHEEALFFEGDDRGIEDDDLFFEEGEVPVERPPSIIIRRPPPAPSAGPSESSGGDITAKKSSKNDVINSGPHNDFTFTPPPTIATVAVREDETFREFDVGGLNEDQGWLDEGRDAGDQGKSGAAGIIDRAKEHELFAAHNTRSPPNAATTTSWPTFFTATDSSRDRKDAKDHFTGLSTISPTVWNDESDDVDRAEDNEGMEGTVPTIATGRFPTMVNATDLFDREQDDEQEFDVANELSSNKSPSSLNVDEEYSSDIVDDQDEVEEEGLGTSHPSKAAQASTDQDEADDESPSTASASTNREDDHEGLEVSQKTLIGSMVVLAAAVGGGLLYLFKNRRQ